MTKDQVLAAAALSAEDGIDAAEGAAAYFADKGGCGPADERRTRRWRHVRRCRVRSCGRLPRPPAASAYERGDR
jgi:hypothetical protein